MRDILDMEGWTFIDSRIETDAKGEQVEFLMGEYLHQPKACPTCGSLSLYRHGTKKTTYADQPTRDIPTKLEATVRRYRCRDCEETFLQPLGGVLEDRRMTERCANFIGRKALENTFAAMAKHVGVDEKTVRSIASERMAEVAEQPLPPLPRVLGVDETQILKKQRLVLTDIEGKRLLDMFPYRDQKAFETWLARCPDRGNVQVVTMDMWREYQRIAKRMLPQATIVVDKFHVVRYASWALEQVRIRLGKVKDTEVRRYWVRSRIQLLKRPRNLSEKQAFNLGMWLDNEPELAQAYRLKEAMYCIYDNPTRAEAEVAFNALLASVPPGLKNEFGDLTRLMKNWRPEILAYFDQRYTNAYTESVNNLMKLIVKNGRGYSYDVLRARALAMYGPKPKKALRFEFLVKDAGNPCGNCGLPSRAEDMHPVTLPPMVRGQRAKRALVCALCEARFNTETLKAHRKPSTQ